MRDIKFRVWDNHYKYMNYKVIVGTYGEWEKVKDDENYTACSMWIKPENVDYKCEPHWSHFEPYHKDIKLMQYTGLKDKNGKEIYEGDIVFIKGEVEILDIKGKVEYSETFAQYIITNTGDIVNEAEPLGDYEDIEVMGNIYDNPELLEKGKEE